MSSAPCTCPKGSRVFGIHLAAPRYCLHSRLPGPSSTSNAPLGRSAGDAASRCLTWLVGNPLQTRGSLEGTVYTRRLNTSPKLAEGGERRNCHFLQGGPPLRSCQTGASSKLSERPRARSERSNEKRQTCNRRVHPSREGFRRSKFGL